MTKKLLLIFSFTLVFVFQKLSFGQIDFTVSAASGSYVANTAPTTIHAAGVDDALSASLPIGFTFQYGCVNYTNFKASSNGWLTFNTAVTANNAFNNLATSSDRPIIAPLWDDLAVGSGGTVNYKLTGTSPNRVLTVEWSQMEWSYSATTWGIGFQVKLYETTNVIEFIYNRNGTAGANLVSPSASIGVSGTTVGEFYSLQDVTASPTYSTTTETTNLSTKPATGQIYRFTPPATCSGTPTAGTANAAPTSICVGSSSSLTVSGSTTGCGLTYQWQSAPAAAGPWTNITGATSISYVASPIVSTYYRRVITCAGSANSSSVLVTITGAPTYATIPYNQSFEGPWLSVCSTRERPDVSWMNTPTTGNASWRRHDDGVAGATWSSNSGLYTPNFSAGSYSARFHSYDASSGTQGSLDLYVNLSPAGTKSLCFDYINTSGSDVLSVQLSTDGGSTFPTTLLSLTTAAAWSSQTISISSTSATSVIRFIATSDYGGSDIGIDNLSLSLPSPPNCATYNSPTNGATGIICGINAILDWSAPTVTACNPASSYDVYFGTAASPPFVVNQTGLTYNPGTLLPSTTYYWRIVPRNSAGPAVCATVWSFTTGASFSGSQTVPPISDDFENCLDWTIVNGAAVNKWILGSATSNGGTKSMYVNNTGTNNNYAHTASVVHFYKDITLPTGMTTSLAFDWKADGESCCDYLYVSLVPTTYTPTEGTAIPGTYILGNYKFNVQTTWQTFNYNLPSCGGTTMRLVFTWRNDGSVGTQPPAAVDNINIVAVNTTGQTCANPVNIILPYNRTGESTDCMINDYTNASTSSCGTAFESGQDRVYKAVIGVAGCISVNITNANDNSIGFQVYNGCPDVGGTTCIGNFGGAIAGSLAGDINIPAPGTYYFVVDNFAGPTSVNYDISISAPGGNTANDLPCNATAMTLGISSNGDNTCTNATGEPANPACWGTGALNTVWYAITVPASMDVYIRTTAISLLNTQIAAYTTTNCASAAAFTMVGCNVNAPNCGSSTNNTSELLLNNVAPAGTVLYIRVDGFGSLTGSFSILAIDGNNGAATWPTVPGQDCMMSNPVCNATMSVGNPGYFSFGNICDFPTGSTCLASGERSSVWYTININANGNLTFDIVPNDYGNPNPITGQANPGYTTQGSESDYDWALWKISGSGSTTCAGIAGGAAALKCNYNSLGVTGLYGTTDGTNNPAYPGYGAAYQSQQAVLNGEVYILVVSNFANNYVSGFSLVFGGSPPPIAMTATTTSVTWAGTTNTSWNQPGNWSNACSAPNCAIDATITTGGAQPVITANSTVKNLTINAGATLTINAGVTLTVCGNFTNNGTLIASPTSTILFDNASVTHTISGSVTGTNRFGNLTINKTGGSVQLAASTNFEIAGNFTTMNATSILNVNNNYLKIGGNFNTASNVTLTNCPTIEFNGVIPQTFTNTAGTHALTNVVMNNTSSGITLTGTASSNMVLSGALTLTNGVIYTATTPILIMNAGSTATSGSASSFVDGPMQKIGNTAFVFPVGDAFNRWMRIAMTAPTTSSTFQAQYFYTPYSTLTPMAVTPTPVLNNVSAIEYWQFDRIAGTGNASLTLYWQNASSSGINSCAALQGGDLVVARWNGSAWENRSNTITGGITGSCVGTSAGTVTSDPLTAFSPFTFASKTAALNPLPVELISFTGENFGSENILKWTTLTETNNDFFTLERTLNGYTFETLGVVDGYGSGNSTTRHDYNFIDAHPVEGMNYYRLKQTDFNGDVKYYPELVAINYTKTTDYGLYPNPANNEIMIYTSNSKDETVNIHITDVTGRVMLQESTLTLKEKGLNGSKIDISAYPNGIYFIMINDLNGKPISQKRFVKSK